MSNPPHFHKIRRVEVTHGFLGGLKIELSDHLNCVIGTRGAGKTTLLEFLRYALRGPGRDERGKAQIDLINKNLRSGTIRVEVETKQGVTYTIERKSGEAPQVLNQANEVVALSLEDGHLFGAQFYSQSEIEEIATTPADKLALIDQFAEEELQALALEFRTIERKLRSSANELVGLAGEVQELDEGDLDTQLTAVTEELRGLESSGADENDQVQEAMALRASREAERRALSELLLELRRDREQLQGQAKRLARRAETFVPPEALSGPNKVLLGRAQEVMEELAEGFQALQHQLSSSEGALAQLEGIRAALVTAHHEQEQTFEQMIQAHSAAQESAQRRIQTQRRQADLTARRQERQGKLEVLTKRREARRQLTRKLSELREERAGTRARVIDDLNSKLKGSGIKIEFVRQKDNTLYLKRLSEAFRGSRRRGQAEIARKITSLTPRGFVRFVSTNNADELAFEAKLERTDAAWVVGQLRDTLDLYELEVVERADEPRILFKDGERWKDSGELSTGQKFTAILPILLLHSEQPLVCDEPESHLDQATLVEKVVTQIRNMRGERQLIFATHNPNLVVLGDVGESHVVVLESTGDNAKVVQAGTVDELRSEIEQLLEGGADAFRERACRYGLIERKPGKE